MADAPVDIPSAHAAREHLSTNNVKLHPLVLVNITDHYTRINFDADPKKKKTDNRAIGALIGQQDAKSVEIHTSFEVLYTVEKTASGDQTIVIDLAFMRGKKAQYNQVFPDYEVVGWYTTGSGLSKADIVETNRSVAGEFCDAPIVMVMDTNPGPNVKTLPVYLFESVATMVGNSQIKASNVRKIRYNMESEESERIGIDTAMKVDFASEKNPTLVPQAQRLGSAVYMLKTRLTVILAYLKEVRAKKINPDYEMLRQICTVTNQLPCADSPSFTHAVQGDYDDAVVVSLLGVLTRSAFLLDRVVEKSNVYSERRKMGTSGMAMSGIAGMLA